MSQVKPARLEALATVAHELALFDLQQGHAIGALEVSGDVLLHVALSVELFVANVAAERLLARVNALVPCEVGV